MAVDSNLDSKGAQREGSLLALALLAAMEVLPREDIGEYAALGELSLDGSLNPVAGVRISACYIGRTVPATFEIPCVAALMRCQGRDSFGIARMWR